MPIQWPLSLASLSFVMSSLVLPPRKSINDLHVLLYEFILPLCLRLWLLSLLWLFFFSGKPRKLWWFKNVLSHEQRHANSTYMYIKIVHFDIFLVCCTRFLRYDLTVWFRRICFWLFAYVDRYMLLTHTAKQLKRWKWQRIQTTAYVEQSIDWTADANTYNVSVAFQTDPVPG